MIEEGQNQRGIQVGERKALRRLAQTMLRKLQQ
jgi:hypothetical protein